MKIDSLIPFNYSLNSYPAPGHKSADRTGWGCRTRLGSGKSGDNQGGSQETYGSWSLVLHEVKHGVARSKTKQKSV